MIIQQLNFVGKDRCTIHMPLLEEKKYPNIIFLYLALLSDLLDWYAGKKKKRGPDLKIKSN